MQLREYQTEGINRLAYKASLGLKRLILQLATGSGKTVMFSGLVHRYIIRQNKKVVIAVHRQELLAQARKTLYNWHGIVAQPIVAGQKHLPDAQVYVAMVETVNKRLQKNPNYFGNIGMLIVDECHLANFRKLFEHFPCLIIGFSATPISSSRKHPLKDIYDDIICCIDIPDLISDKALVPNRTYHIKNINRKTLTIKNGEFDEEAMGNEFSKGKHVQNSIEGYRKHCKGKKTIVFNCNIQHSKIVTQAFIEAGYNARHLDGEMSTAEREEIFHWLKTTPDAILNNVAIATTGFDEPSIEAVIMNKSTLSLPLWLQCTGRGSRPFEGKQFFTIIDMGGNALAHGDWCATRDWYDLFHNPDKPGSGGGVAPIKECVQCEAIISASANTCKFCGADNSSPVVYDAEKVEFELLTQSNPLPVTVKEVIDRANGKNPYYALHQMKFEIINHWKVKEMTDGIAYKMLEIYQGKVKEWCKEQGKQYNQFHKTVPAEWFLAELDKKYNWKPETQSLSI